MPKQDGHYAVNLDSPVAVYVQIEDQIQFGIASGRLKPGDSLPSVREMSSMLQVNPNTVTKAYRDLELLQMLDTRRGVGVTVSEKAPKICRERTIGAVRQRLCAAVDDCLACGLSAAEIQAAVKAALTGTSAEAAPARKKK